MFKRISGFKKGNEELIFINERFEYFHNYWSTVNSNNNNIFFNEIRFESHRSLLIKIEDQLLYNFKKSYPWFKQRFLEHPFFQTDNILGKNPSVKKHIEALRKLFTFRKQYESNRTKVIWHVKKIESTLLKRNNYSIRLANLLKKILGTNKKLTEKNKADIRFLVSAYIVELYYHGYNLDYISKIPDILLSHDPINDFPFNKNLFDFDYDKEAYKKYKSDELKVMTLDKMLSGLSVLVNKPFTHGYCIFKVNNVSIKDPHPLEIGNVKFYNPKISSELNLNDTPLERRDRYIKAEAFINLSLPDEMQKLQFSECNAIIKCSFRNYGDKQASKNFYASYNEVKKATELLNNIINRQIFYSKSYGAVNVSQKIFLHENKKIAGYSSEAFWEQGQILELKDNNTKELLLEELKYYNNINLNTDTGKKIFHVLTTSFELKNKIEQFNFKDIWIAWESLFPKEEFINFAKKCFYIKFKKNYITSIILFLHSRMKPDGFHSKNHYYFLTKEQELKLGLKIEAFKKVPTTKFHRNYKLLNEYVPISLVKELTLKVDQFLNNQDLFFQKLNKWLAETIDEVYIERNMEVHKNLQNDLSTMKLRDDFMYITDICCAFIIQYADKRNFDNMQLLHKRIDRESEILFKKY